MEHLPREDQEFQNRRIAQRDLNRQLASTLRAHAETPVSDTEKLLLIGVARVLEAQTEGPA